MNWFLYDNRFKIRFFRHTLFFLIIVFLFTTIMYIQNTNDRFLDLLWITSLNALFFFGYAYITIFLLIPEFLLTRKIAWFILLFLLTGIALSAIKLIASDHIFYSAISPENIQRKGLIELRYIVVNTKDMTFIVAFFCIARYVKDFLYAEKIRKKLENENKTAQAKLIQSQFDPHFLFNTINNLYALSLLNPQKTNEVIDRIKLVLQYIVKEIQKDFVDLKDEVLLVENYIQLEKLRYGQRLNVEFKVAENIQNKRIPPMVLFFLVENCFKHGSSLDAGTPWIKIEVSTNERGILMLTENSKPQSVANNKVRDKKKYDLKDLRKRLEIIYQADGFKLETENLATTFKVNLELIERIEIIQNTYR